MALEPVEVRVAYPHRGDRYGSRLALEKKQARERVEAQTARLQGARQGVVKSKPAPSASPSLATWVLGVGVLAVGYVAFSALMFLGFLGVLFLGPLGTLVVMGCAADGGSRRQRYYGRSEV